MKIEDIDYVAWAEQRVKDKITCSEEPVMCCHPDFTLECCQKCLMESICDCTLTNYCPVALRLSKAEDIKRALYMATTPFSKELYAEYEIASSMRRLHREKALEVRDGMDKC